MTYGENTTGQILWVGQGHSLMQALAHRDGKLQRFTWLGSWWILPEQNLEEQRRKGHSSFLSEGLAEEGLALLWQKQLWGPKSLGLTGESQVRQVMGREIGRGVPTCGVASAE